MHSVVVNYNTIYKKYSDLHLDSLASFALDYVCKYNTTCCSINFISSEEIHKLNKEYRDIDSPTDVLSFECDGIDDDFGSCDTFELGDIFINPELAIKNCEKFQTNIQSELKLLTVHGILHLCGYDHINKEQAEEMEKLEEKILDDWELKKNI